VFLVLLKGVTLVDSLAEEFQRMRRVGHATPGPPLDGHTDAFFVTEWTVKRQLYLVTDLDLRQKVAMSLSKGKPGMRGGFQERFGSHELAGLEEGVP